MTRYLATLPFLVVIAMAVGCSGNGSGSTPTAAATATSAATASPTAVAPTATTVAPTATPGAFNGDTVPVTVTPVPNPAANAALLTDVRVGAHVEDGGYDRIVFEFDSQMPAATVQYVNGAVGCGSGAPVSLPGSAVLEVKFAATNAHDENGNVTIASTDVTGPGNSILESKQTCDFEADVTWDIGVTSQKPFRVQVLQGPPRVVVDVQH